jgi:hypothetical protein
VKILGVRPNNRKKVFEVLTEKREYSFPYAKLETRPSRTNRVREVYPDPELGCEAFTYTLESGVEDTVHVDAVLEYNLDPTLPNDVLLHQLTVEAHEALAESGLSKREVIRRLGTSASQFYRLMDTTYYEKSVGQMLALIRVLGKDVDLVVRPKSVSRENRTSFMRVI